MRQCSADGRSQKALSFLHYKENAGFQRSICRLSTKRISFQVCTAMICKEALNCYGFQRNRKLFLHFT